VGGSEIRNAKGGALRAPPFALFFSPCLLFAFSFSGVKLSLWKIPLTKDHLGTNIS
jgi:hypothetical protein